MKMSRKIALTACTALFGCAPAFAAIDVNNSFSPATRYPGEVSRMTLLLQNSSLTPTVDVALTNALPNGVFIAATPNLTNTCGGTVAATNNASHGTVTISGGSIPEGDGTNSGICRIEVDVQAGFKGTFVNLIPAGALTGVTNGISESNLSPASATLAIILQDVTIGWGATYIGGFTTTGSVVIQGNETVTRRVVINNPNPVALTGTSFVYDLWQNSYNLRIRDDLPMGSTCGATLAVAPRPPRTAEYGPTSELTVTGGTIPANGSCEFFFAVEPSRDPTRPYVGLSLAQSLAANSVVTDQGATNSVSANNTVTTYTGARVLKAFNGVQNASMNFNDSTTAQLRLTFENYNVTDITNINLTDFMPAGMTVQSVIVNSCGGTATFSPDNQLTLTGGTAPGGAPNQAGLQMNGCQIVATVGVAGAGSYINQIPADTLDGAHQFATYQASLNVTGNILAINKSLSRSGLLYAGDTLNASFAIQNFSTTTPITNIRIPDDLATMGYGFRVGPLGLFTNSCGGTANVVPDATSFSIGGIDVAPGGTCNFTVQLITSSDAMLTTASVETRNNTIPVGNILYDTPSTADNVFGLQVQAPVLLYPPVVVSKTFTPATVGPLGTSRLRINISRRSSDRIGMSGIYLIDNLPAGHVVAPSPNIFNGCGGTVNAAPGSGTVELTGASIAMGTLTSVNCFIETNIVAPPLTPGFTLQSSTNTILGDPHGATPRANPRVNFRATDDRQPAPFNEVRRIVSSSAGLTRRATSVTANKEFTPAAINGGGVSRVRITLSNVEPTAINLTGVSLTDAFPATDLRLYTNVNPTYTDPAGNPNANGCTGGTFVGASGGTQITLNGATLAAGRTCVFEFNVTAFQGGNHINRLFAGDLVTNEGVTNNADVSATLTVGYQIGVGKGFSPSVMEAGGQSTLTLDLFNTNVAPNNKTGDSPAIIDTMPAGLQIVPGTASTNCAGGTASAGIDGGGNHFLRLDGGLLAASSACQVQAQVTAATPGIYLNQVPVGALRATDNSASPDPAEALLRVIQPPQITKAFGPTAIPVGGTSTITFTVRNPNLATLLPTGMNGIAFSDTLTNMQVASPLAIGGTCAGVATDAAIGATAFTISNISVGPNSQCTVTIPVTSSTPGLLPNQTSGATSNQTNQAGAPSNIAELRVLQPLTIAKSFALAAVAPGAPVRMTFDLVNPNPVATAISNPGFTDAFPNVPGVMAVAPTPNLSSTCSGSAVRNLGDSANLAAGDLGVLVRGGSVLANTNCQISFDVTANQPGDYVNVTSEINSAGGVAPAASAQLYVLSIAATNDSVSGINGQSGAADVLNVFGGDTINGAPATAATATLSVAAGSSVPAQLNFDTSTGNISVVAGSLAGTYSFVYRICDQSNPLNCTQATASVTIAPSVDLAISKTNTPGVNGEVDQTDDAVVTGTTTNYTIVVTNNGPDAITGAVVTDSVGSGLTCPAGNPVTLSGDGVPAGSFTVGDLTGPGITLGTLTVGQSTTLTLSCQVN